MKESSDKTNRPRTLEEVFRDGFEPAEVKPSTSLWSRIEQDLEVKQVGFYKKRLAWYRSVAAASILLFMLAMAYLWYDTQTVHRLNIPPVVKTTPSPESTNQISLPAQKQIRAATSADEAGKNATSIASAEPKSAAGKPASNKIYPTVPEPKPTYLAQQNKIKKNNRNPDGARSIARRNQPAYANQSLAAAITNQAPATALPHDASAAKSPAQVNEPTENQVVGLEPARQPATGDLSPDSTTLLAQTPAEQPTVTIAAAEPSGKHEKMQPERWALGGGTGPQYFQQNIKFSETGSSGLAYQSNSYANLSASSNRNVGGNSVDDAREEFNENTYSAFSYRAAAGGSYKFNKKWSLEGGVTFAENKAQTLTTYIINKPPAMASKPEKANNNFLDNSASNRAASNVTIPVTIFLAELTDGYLTNNNVTVNKVEPFTMYYRYRQVGVPLKLRYQFGRGNWFTFVQAGGAVNILLQTSILSDSPQVPDVEYTIGESSPFRKWYLTALGSVGKGMKLSEFWQVQGSLDVARNFSSLTANPTQSPDSQQGKSYYVGFGITSSYIIGKKAKTAP